MPRLGGVVFGSIQIRDWFADVGEQTGTALA